MALFIIDWRWPDRGGARPLLLGLGRTLRTVFRYPPYGFDRAGIMSAIGYANIVFSVFIGMAPGRSLPRLDVAGGY